jgi:RNA polymerase sigma-70 factor, ECF subfamily
LAGSWWQVLETGEKRERVSRVGLTAGDLAGARRREPAAVTRVYDAYAPFVLRYFLAAVGDRRTAEDMTGDLFKTAIDRLPGFGGPVEALGGWLFGIAHQDLSAFRRERAGAPGIRALEGTPGEAVPAAGVDDLEPPAAGRIEGDRMLAALRRLPPDQQEVLLLCTAAGLTVPEVATIVGKSTGTVRALRHRGLAGLAGVLGVGNGASSAGSPQPAPLTGLVEQA